MLLHCYADIKVANNFFQNIVLVFYLNTLLNRQRSCVSYRT